MYWIYNTPTLALGLLCTGGVNRISGPQQRQGVAQGSGFMLETMEKHILGFSRFQAEAPQRHPETQAVSYLAHGKVSS